MLHAYPVQCGVGAAAANRNDSRQPLGHLGDQVAQVAGAPSAASRGRRGSAARCRRRQGPRLAPYSAGSGRPRRSQCSCRLRPSCWRT
eukprot:7425675-Pyramimonas_sp.AAC.1